jgi:hypothetical protein
MSSHATTKNIKTFHFDKVDENIQGIIPINTPLRKIKNLELKSATINNPNNIRSENGSNIFGFSYENVIPSHYIFPTFFSCKKYY